MSAHLLDLRKAAFILWLPKAINPAPTLVIGVFAPGNPPTLGQQKKIKLKHPFGHAGLWGVKAGDCELKEGQVYHYWFEVNDSSPTRDGSRILCTDPFALTVDWRLLAPRLPAPHIADDQDPASVVMFSGGELVACDPGGERFAPAPIIGPGGAANNRLVIYELPTSWARINQNGYPEIGVGTFSDVMALIDEQAEGANFADHAALNTERLPLLAARWSLDPTSVDARMLKENQGIAGKLSRSNAH